MAVTKTSAIIGTFEGVCADAAITNANGLDITRPVWEAVFDSDEYKLGIKNGYFIGYLGHPDTPDYAHFQDGCIVMTEGHIDNDDKIRGKFNLIDTPVGRIVKTFIDAGVTFGISVRGAGDIYNNSVEPGSFVFRGFDLVAFPAWEEAVPKFSEIAASTDTKKRESYKKVCAAVEVNLKDITSAESLKIIRDQFPKQSQTYKDVDAAISSVENKPAVNANEVKEALNKQKIEAMVDLYIAAQHRVQLLEAENKSLKHHIHTQAIKASKKTQVRDRIMSEQMEDLQSHSTQNRHAVGETQKKLVECQKKLNETRQKLTAARNTIASQNEELKTIKAANEELTKKSTILSTKLDMTSKSNLQYRREANKAKSNSDSRSEEISSLKSNLRKTVAERDDSRTKVSDLEARNKKLEQQIAASEKLVADYQDAYATMYANAVGVSAENIPITSNTSVSELKSIITGNNTFDRQPDNITDVYPDMSTVDDLSSDDIVAL